MGRSASACGAARALAALGPIGLAAGRSSGGVAGARPRGRRGFPIDGPLPVLGRAGDPWAHWLERFAQIYGRQLIRQGRWSTAQASRAEAEMSDARSASGSYWVGPSVLELQASGPGRASAQDSRNGDPRMAPANR